MQIPILYLIDFLNFFSGTEKNLYDLVRMIDKKKFKPYIITFEGTETFRKQVEALGVPIQILGLKKIYGIKAFKVFFKLRRFIKNENIQIIQTFHTNPDLYGTVLAKLSGIPIIVSSRRDMGFTRNSRNILSYRILNRFVDGFICVSEAVKNLTLREGGASLNKIKVIYNGIDINQFDKDIDTDSIKKDLNLLYSVPTIGVLGNFNLIKGHIYFFKAVSLVRKKIPNLQCILVGKGLLEHKLKRQAHELKIDDCVHFLGHRSDIPEVLSVMDILVVPSLSEGFSNTILEALYMRRPVLATKVGGNPEVIIQGETGILIPPKNSFEMAKKIITLLNDKNLSTKLGENGRKLVSKKFIINKMVAETESFYINLLKRKGLIYD